MIGASYNSSSQQLNGRNGWNWVDWYCWWWACGKYWKQGSTVLIHVLLMLIIALPMKWGLFVISACISWANKKQDIGW
jgi:hypothetical protein